MAAIGRREARLRACLPAVGAELRVSSKATRATWHCVPRRRRCRCLSKDKLELATLGVSKGSVHRPWGDRVTYCYFDEKTLLTRFWCGYMCIPSSVYTVSMPVVIDGVVYYSSGEAAARLRRHRLTLLRWIREGKIPEVRRDRLGRRLFTEGDIDLIKKFAAAVTQPKRPSLQLPLPLSRDQSRRQPGKRSRPVRGRGSRGGS